MSNQPARDGETLSTPPTTCDICGSATGNPSHGNCTPTYCRATQAAIRSHVAALRAQLAEARAELKRWDELRRAAAECIDQDPATWPEHGNAPLAIASALALRQLKLGGRLGANLESDTNG